MAPGDIAMTLPGGTQLGPYTIVHLLGAGGMGEVYRAHDPRLGRDVALKVLPAAYVSDSERRARFLREARAAAALDHPNIISIHDVGADTDVPFIVAELLEGTTLRAHLTPGVPWPARKVVEVAQPIARGLAAAHDWIPTGNGIYFIDGSLPQPAIQFYDFASRRVRRIAAIPGTPVQWGGGLAVSSDERTFFFSQVDEITSDIMLVENFR